ncbi:DoxX family protein [Oryzicola mucosus]|uniref:DoxX family protein n=1 Tax=Oryzicola mucosus TaxID=2767425 RepID=A0A8J6PZG9_9HYPH|nr:DoxX family protein [Oryzicola mucosus]MBD0413750.1 DoxX family protein [Oryzicola mucosus]
MSRKSMLWAGRVLSAIFVLFMLGASITPKFLGMAAATDTMRQLGWPDGYVLMIGIIELICVLLYVFPKTSVLGAVLMMGVLGGAMATQIRIGNPLFSHVLFSIYLGLFMWGGLWLRDPALRAIFPWRQAG